MPFQLIVGPENGVIRRSVHCSCFSREARPTLWVSEALATTHGQILFDSSQIPGLATSVYGLRRSFVAEHPDQVRKFLQVWQRASTYVREHREETFAIIAAANHHTVEQVRDFAALDDIFDERDNKLAFSFASGYDSRHGTAHQISDFLLAKGLTDRPLDSESFLDPSFVRALSAP